LPFYRGRNHRLAAGTEIEDKKFFSTRRDHGLSAVHFFIRVDYRVVFYNGVIPLTTDNKGTNKNIDRYYYI
jgi:hypothetical protein